MLTLVDRFLTFLEEEQECSANTAAAYRNDLTQFTRYVRRGAVAGADDCAPAPADAPATQLWAQVNPALVDEYVSWLHAQPYASATVARKVAALKSFFHWSQEHGELATNPATGVESPKVKRLAPRGLEAAEIERLLAAPGHESSPAGLRDQALVETLYATGMRVSEVVSLNLEDLALDASTLHCGGKHARTAPLTPSAQAALRAWIEEGRAQLQVVPNEMALFLNYRGQRLTRQGLWLIIKRYVRQAGIEAPVTPHTLRNAFAAHQLRAGMDLAQVAHLLGHTSTHSTQAYRRMASVPATPQMLVDGKRWGINDE